MSPEERSDNASPALRGIRKQIENKNALWMREATEWSYDLSRGLIEFYLKDGGEKGEGKEGEGRMISIPIQVIGSYHFSTRSWLWAWGNASLPPSVLSSSITLKAYGEKHRILPFVTRACLIDEEQAWEFSAIANLIGEGGGVFRAPSEDSATYFVMGRGGGEHAVHMKI